LLSETVRRYFVAAVLLLGVTLLVVFSRSLVAGSDPWAKAQTVRPADLARELENPRPHPPWFLLASSICRPPQTSRARGITARQAARKVSKEFTTLATSVPRTANLVMFCGCCPIDRCPAVKALQGLGFNNVRVLLLPTDFETDWAETGLPYDQGI